MTHPNLPGVWVLSGFDSFGDREGLRRQNALDRIAREHSGLVPFEDLRELIRTWKPPSAVTKVREEWSWTGTEYRRMRGIGGQGSNELAGRD